MYEEEERPPLWPAPVRETATDGTSWDGLVGHYSPRRDAASISRWYCSAAAASRRRCRSASSRALFSSAAGYRKREKKKKKKRKEERGKGKEEEEEEVEEEEKEEGKEESSMDEAEGTKGEWTIRSVRKSSENKQGV